MAAAGTAHAAVPPGVNFTTTTGPAVSGYTPDTGLPYDDTRAFGWVRQDSLTAASHVPLDVTARPRQRNANANTLLDTFISMQAPSGTTGVPSAAWEVAVPVGTYTVKVSAGDASYLDSNHRIRVEGVVALNTFTPTSATRFANGTVTVNVTDGRLTIDASGGVNTKINYVDILADSTAPAAPVALTGTAGSGKVDLAWTANTESDLAGYDVYRSTTTPVALTPANKLNTATITGTAYSDTTAQNGTAYRYVVVARDVNSNSSAASNEIGATPIDTTPPAAPTGVNAAPGNNKVTLSWTANPEPDVASYRVFRGTTPTVSTTGTPLAAGVTTTGYVDTTALNDTTYYYVIVARDTATLDSPASATVSAVPTGADIDAPAPPTALVATSGNGRVTLAWASNTDTDLAGYRVYRSTSETVPTTGNGIAGLLTTTSFVDTTVTNGTTYFYAVVASDTAGNSSPGSAAASATPLAPVDSLSVNFQAQTTTPPVGYTGDYGQAFDTGRGYGWTTAAGAPLSMVGNGRERNVLTDKRLDTFISMQLPAGSTGVTTPGNWKAALPNGTYRVTVAVGDPNFLDSRHVIRLENQPLIDFTPNSGSKSMTASLTLAVTDGALDLSPTGGTNTKINYVRVERIDPNAPHVTAITPDDAATGVCRDSALTVQLSDGIDPETATSDGVQLLNPQGVPVPGYYNTDGAYSNITFVPSVTLAANTLYTIRTTGALKSPAPAGASYAPYTSTFTTSAITCQAQSDVTFTPSTFDFSDGTAATTTAYKTNAPSAMALGPNPAAPTQLWVGTGTGQILVYNLNATTGKPVGAPTQVNTFSFNRVIASLRFDPTSTAGNIKLWVSNGEFGCDLAAAGIACPDMTGAISTLTGTDPINLQRTEVVTGLPRSVGNHMNNGIDFGPDGALYLAQGAQNGYGSPDAIWGNRAEVPLAAAILRIDLAGIGSAVPYNVNTTAGYNYTLAASKVKPYVTGTRNPFSVLWHSNGKLYAPVNESANGNSPADPAGGAPALSDLPAFNDYFTQIVAGKYYGHPNPTRNEYRLNGANPTAGSDPFEVPQYPVGTQPNSNWRAPDMDLGVHRSADGSAEFKSDVFGDKLKGQILVTEYAGGKDIIAVKLDANGKPVSKAVVANGLYNPLPIVTDPISGRVYVGEYGRDPDGDGGKLTMLDPVPAPTGDGVHIDFQPQGVTPAAGYTADFGQAYDATRGRGWERNDTSAPLAMTGNGRQRNIQADKRLDTFVSMQSTAAADSQVPARWELDVPNGVYTLTVGVGDAQYIDSRHVINAEGQQILDFTPTNATKNRTVTAQVTIADGRLTLTPTNGTNTKLGFVDLVAVPDNPPAAPTGVAATPGQGHVVLDWTAPADTDVAGYRVFRSTTPTVPTSGTGISPINPNLIQGTSFDDTTAAGGVTYYYVVVAVDNGGHASVASSTVNATPSTVAPDAPTGLVATAGDAKVDLGWTPNPETNISGYDVYRVTGTGPVPTSGAGVSPINQAPVTAASYSDTTAVNRTTYSYAIVAINPGGRSGSSNQVSATPVDTTAPVQASALTATPGDGQVALGWTASPSLDVAGYNVYRATSASVPTTAANKLNTALITGSTYTDVPATNGTTYSYVVVAVDTSDNVSPSSNEAVAIPSAAAPAAPTALVATAGNGQVVLTWTQSATAGVTGYRVYRDTGTGTVPSGPTATPLATVATVGTYTDATAANGTAYHYVVVAIGGTGAASAASNDVFATPVAPPPAAPTALTATSGNAQVVLGWTASAGPSLAGYNVYRSTTTPVVTSAANQLNTALVTGTAYTDVSAVNGTAYSYVVVAVSTSTPPASSTASNTASATPSGLTRKVDFTTTTAPTVAGYTADTGLPYNETRGFGWVTESTLATTHTPIDLSARTRARNTNTADRRLDTFAIAQGTGNTPAGWEIAVPNGTYSVTVAVGDPGYTDSTHRMTVEGTLAINNFAPTTANLYRTATVTVTVTDGRVTLSAAGGTNTKPSYVDVTQLTATAPNAPTALAATAGDGQVALSWTASTSSNVAGYRVYRATGSGTIPTGAGATSQNTALITGTSYTDVPATNGTAYRYVVVAVDSSSTPLFSAASNEVTATPQASPPAAPTALTATPGNGTVGLSWTASTTTGVAGYNVYRSTGATVETTPANKLNTELVTGTTYLDPTAANGTAYRYVVVTVSSTGLASAASNDVVATPTAPIPAPTGLTATAGNARVSLSWNPVPGVAGYRVYRATGGTAPIPTGAGVTPLNATLIPSGTTTYLDTAITPNTTYRYVVVAVDSTSATPNFSPASNEVSAIDDSVHRKINFQPAASMVPANYTADTGLGFSAARGFGWVTQASLPSATHSALDISARMRARNVNSDLRLDTFAIAQGPGNVAAGWEMAVPNGRYLVKVSTGDASYTDSVNRVTVEGTVAINSITPTATARFQTGTVDVFVSDGRLTLDFTNGTNTKPNYVDIDQLDSAPPAAPANVVATPGSSQNVISWAPNTEPDLAGYRVYRTAATTGAVPTTTSLNTALITGSSYTDTTAINGTTYRYVVRAIDTSGNASPSSSEGSATPVDTTAPNAPTALGAVPSNNQVALSWTASTSGDTAGYRVYRQTGPGPIPTGGAASSVNTALITGTTYTDTTAVNGTAYRYVVVAVDNAPAPNFSVPSNEVTATPIVTDTTPPANPVALTATPADSSVALTWTANSEPDLAGYRVYRSTGAATPAPGSGTLLNTALVTTASYTDTTALNGVAYRYAVVAVDNAPPPGPNVSGTSNLVTATPAGTPPPATPLRVNFQPAAAAVPANYTADGGLPFLASRGYGWIRQDSIGAPTPVGLDVSATARDRDLAPDQRQDTFISMQGGTSAAWEGNLANGDYTVTVGVGDAGFVDSVNRIVIEGTPVVIGHVPLPNNRFGTATAKVRVTDGRLTIDPSTGVNTKIDYVDIAAITADTTAPGAATAPNATAGNGRAIVRWTASTATDVAGYRVYRSTSTPVTLTAANQLNTLESTTSYTDRTAADGTPYFYAVVAVDQVGNTSAKTADVTATPAAGTEGGTLTATNLDATPSTNGMTFSRIGLIDQPATNGVHDRATLRIRNTGTAPLRLDTPTFAGPFTLITPPAFPALIPANGTLDLQVKFIAGGGRVTTGTITLPSSDAAPATVVPLAGYWQSVSEEDLEPSPQEMVDLFGWKTTIANNGQILFRGGRIERVGDEILVPFWQRLNTTQPVGVTQLAAYHVQGNTANFGWFNKGNSGTINNVLTHAGTDGQSMLPHRNGSTTALANTTFTPTQATFGFKMDSEFTDPILNNQLPDRTAGCLTGCGHHVRVWPVKDATGAVVPGSYLVGMDYAGINYDYQDNFYLVTNVTPQPAPAALPRVDTGSTAGFTGGDARVWSPDSGLFNPTSTTITGTTGTAIANTTDDALYATTRNNVGNATPVSQRVLSYRVPETGYTTANVTLHFAELAFNNPTRRVFDVQVEGTTRTSNYDIWAATSSINFATTLTYNNVSIGDGWLDLALKVSVDMPTISAIEVKCVTGSDATCTSP